MSSFQVKIVGDFCNIRCAYCRNRDFDQKTDRVMGVETLERLFGFLTTLHQPHVRTHWHGGEPLLAGKEFFTHIVRLEQDRPQTVWANAVQTNGILIDEEWANFFREHRFHVGVSIDGSERTHDIERVNVGGRGTYRAAMAGVELLRRHSLSPSTICTVTKKTVHSGKEMLSGLVEAGFKDIAFNAFYNTASREADDDPYALTASEWLTFLIEIFETWAGINDPGVRVREIDAMLAWTKSKSANLCSYRGLCHQWFVVDHDGEIYPCERFGRSVHFGGINSFNSFDDIYASQVFKNWKATIGEMPDKCRSCELQSLCHNGCMAHGKADENGVPLYRFCESRLGFYDYVSKRIEGKVVERNVSSKRFLTVV